MKFLNLALITPFLVLNCASLVTCDGNPDTSATEDSIWQPWDDLYSLSEMRPSWLPWEDRYSLSESSSETFRDKTHREPTIVAPGPCKPEYAEFFDATESTTEKLLDFADGEFLFLCQSAPSIYNRQDCRSHHQTGIHALITNVALTKRPCRKLTAPGEAEEDYARFREYAEFNQHIKAYTKCVADKPVVDLATMKSDLKDCRQTLTSGVRAAAAKYTATLATIDRR